MISWEYWEGVQAKIIFKGRILSQFYQFEEGSMQHNKDSPKFNMKQRVPHLANITFLVMLTWVYHNNWLSKSQIRINKAQLQNITRIGVFLAHHRRLKMSFLIR